MAVAPLLTATPVHDLNCMNESLSAGGVLHHLVLNWNGTNESLSAGGVLHHLVLDCNCTN